MNLSDSFVLANFKFDIIVYVTFESLMSSLSSMLISLNISLLAATSIVC